MTDTAKTEQVENIPETEASNATEYQVLARKYRPRNFEELKGQDALVRTLTNAIETGRVAHAFMLTGVRGVGKTTTARIIARALNCIGPDGQGGATPHPCGECENCQAIGHDRHVDVLEMDAASRTGVGDIREIIDSVQYAPSSARYKVYIIDEVHMLSTQAFNALLKTLEEPPEHVKFVFATTEIRKVPITVLSRCQRFDLRRVDADVLQSYFSEIATKEGASFEDEAMALIARAADGSVRDGLSLLDQAISFDGKEITEDRVRHMLGLADRAVTFDLFETVMQGDADKTFEIINGLYNSGADPLVLLQDMMELTHFLTKTKAAPQAINEATLPEAERTRGKTMAENLTMPVLTRTWQILLKGVAEVQASPRPQQTAEMVLIRLIYAADLPAPGDLVKKIQKNGTGQTTGTTETTPTPPPSASTNAEATTTTAGTTTATATTMMTTQAAGSAQAQVQEQPQPETHIEQIPVEQPQPTSFLEVVELFGEMKEPIIQAQIKREIHLVKFTVGHIELRLIEDADQKIISTMTKRLSDWTGQRWVVSLSEEQGQPTLAEQEKEAEIKELSEIKENPTVAKILQLFPGADIEDIERSE